MSQETAKPIIKLNLTPKSLIFGTIFLVSCLAFLIFNPEILMEISEDGYRTFYMEEALICAGLIMVSYLLFVLKFNIPLKIQKAISLWFLLLVPLICTITVEWINDSDLFHKFNIVRWAGNYLCNLALFWVLYAITRRINITVIAASLISIVFGIANYYTLEIRGLPVLPWDFSSIATAMGVAGGYDYNITFPMACTALVFFVLFIFSCKMGFRNKKESPKNIAAERIISASFAAFLLVALLPMDLLGNMGISVWPWNQKASTSMIGVPANFFGNLQFVLVEKPDNYSKQTVENLYEELSSESESIAPSADASGENSLPTIIAVMNESLTDMAKTSDGNIELNQDNIPFIHSLMESENVISGTAYSSVFGGNTCDSEFEFLTGNSMSFLPVGSKPFQQYIDSNQTSLVNTLKQNDYECIAIHPGVETAWNRDTAYPFLGFDEYVYNTEFNTKRKFLRGLTDDASCYREVIQRYENHKAASEDPLFIWNVTIQNHGGYENEDFENTMSIKDHEGIYPKAEEYFSVINHSDTDFKILYDYFSAQEEPVIIVMFGDHWPNLEESFTKTLLGVDDLNSLSIESNMRKFEVPYLIWANYPLNESDMDFGDTSLNYLSSLLLDSAGLELTAYNSFLLDLHETLPVINSIGMIDKDGNYYSKGTPTPYDDLLNDYAVLQYNQLFGDKEKIDDVFTLANLSASEKR